VNETIDERSRVEAEDEDRSVAAGAEERQRIGRVVRELQHEPRRRHRLHPGADDRHRLTDVVATELRILKRRKLKEPAMARLSGRGGGANGGQFSARVGIEPFGRSRS